MSSSPPRYCPGCGAATVQHASFCPACGRSLKTLITPPSPPLDTRDLQPISLTGLLPAAHVLKGRYHITRQVGKGGFGAVYQAMDKQIGNRLVAVKEMSQYGLGTQELATASEAFQREAFLLAHLKHANLPSIYDYFSEAGRWYVIMEFIEGETLEAHLRRGRTPIEKTLAIGIQLCAVLEYLHTRQPPIIFRDLKPANVMLTAEDHLYLIDFGIARHFKPGQSKDTMALGSPGYAPPEQYGKAQTTPRSDIYSLGALLHYMLTGRDPYYSPFRFAPLQLEGYPQAAALQRLIMQMVDAEPDKRPASIEAVKRELERLVASKESGGSYFLSPPLLKPALSPGAPVTTHHGYTGVVRALAWSPDSTRIASASEDGIVQVWDASTGQTFSTFGNHSGCVYTVAWSPDGLHIASAGRDKTVQVWNAPTEGKSIPFGLLGGGKHLTYRGHSEAVRAVAWSPDGRFIASASNDKTVQVWRADNGHLVATYGGHYSWVYAVAWAPDGTRIASAGRDKRVRIWDAATGTHIRTYRGHSGIVRTVAWSPDGRYLASAGNDRMVQVWQSDTMQHMFTCFAHVDYVNAVAWAPIFGRQRQQDSMRFLSASNDKTVNIWDVAGGGNDETLVRSPIFTYRGHSSWVWTAAWSPDGTRIASGGDDRVVQVWSAG